MNKISVLMTVYNCEDYVRYAIDSILNQTYQNFEFIIVDDCSNDNSKKIIREFKDDRIKIFELNKRLGRTKALNFGLKKCNHSFIAIQDSDDISKKDRLLKSLTPFEDKGIGMVFSKGEVINSNGQIKRLIPVKKIDQNFSNLRFENYVAHSSTMFRSHLKNNKFFYDEDFTYAQDYKMILTFLKETKIKFLDDNLVQIRYHDKNMTNDKKIEKIRINESLKLINYSEKNFNNDLKLNIFALSQKIKLYLKLFLLNLKISNNDKIFF